MRQITTTECYKQLCQWKNFHMEQHNCSEKEALEWAYENVLNPPGPAGDKCEKVEVING